MQKKFFAVLLAVCMIVSMLPAMSFAETDQFSDVKKTDWFYDAVQFAVENGLMNGTSSTKFEPNGTLTRAMFVTILGRYAGVDAALYKDVSFSDVKKGEWYAPYVQWAYNNDITKGVGGGKFGVKDPVTREQMAVLIANYVKSEGITLPAAENPVVSFKDAAKVSSWAIEGLELMRTTGLIQGDKSGYFLPNEGATRAQAATIFQRLISSIENSTALNVGDIGSIVKFGSFDQDGDEENGEEIIEWIVLDKQDDKALLITKNYATLDATPLTDPTVWEGDSSWEKSSMRDYFNNDFYMTAFSPSERSAILETDVENPSYCWGFTDTAKKNYTYSTNKDDFAEVRYESAGENNTRDKLFLPSLEEVSKYKLIEKFCPCGRNWWLRSHGNGDLQFAMISKKGEVDTWSGPAYYCSAKVMMWVRTTEEPLPVKTFKVSFNTDGGSSVSDQIVEAYDKAVRPEDPTKDGYMFAGWFEDQNYTKEFSFNRQIKINTALYARFVKKGSGLSNVGAVDSTYIFGAYEQDNDLTNGKEAIEWTVVKKENGKALLLSNNILDFRAFSEEGYSTYDTSDIRAWLNSTFINTAFSESEISNIDIVPLMFREYKYEYDKVFLPTYDEVRAYRQALDNVDFTSPVTNYAAVQGNQADKYAYKRYGTGPYWTRGTLSYELAEQIAINDTNDGGLSSLHQYNKNGVRPAIWVTLK